ncbi:carbohydrate ABC transporter permease [Variovorax sp. HJSM1_2]|uniref:carbohydrate ABC transporter permease n=1 Tax=Variovorax sp. HJSM1_2 TaxID=3366263 RepID=UPI003BCBF9B1
MNTVTTSLVPASSRPAWRWKKALASRSAMAWPMVAPAQVLVLTVLVVPALYVLWLSFYSSTFGKAPTFVGLANYLHVLTDGYFWRALWNTVLIIVTVVHVELLLGLAMALLFTSGVPAKRLLLAATLAPYAVSEVSAAAVWRFLFDPDAGPVTQAVMAMGLPPLEWSINPAHGLSLIALLSIWLHLPFTFLILYAARLSIPTELYEAARIDGATAWQSFRRITLPLLMPAILLAALFRYIFVFRIFSEAWLLTGGGPARTTEVVGVYLYLEAFRFNAFGAASATGWVMVLVSLLLGAGYLWALRRQGRQGAGHGH